MLSYSLRMDRLAQLIERGPVLIDGAMGTELNARGAGAGQCLEELNLAQPVLVAGSVGPLGRPIEPVGAIKRTSARRIFGEQLQALVDGGVDLLVLETF